MADPKAEVEAFWRNDYAAPFLDRDPIAYASNFTLPCLIRAEGLGRRVFTDRAALVLHCAEMIAKAEETRWQRSTIDSLTIEILDAEVATVKVVASRFDAEDRQIARLYGRYTLNREGRRWKMAAIFGGFLPE